MSFIGIGLGALLRGTVSGWWAEYKKRRERDGLEMRQRDGVWQPSRLVPRVDRAVDWLSYAGMVCVVVAIAAALYAWLR